MSDFHVMIYFSVSPSFFIQIVIFLVELPVGLFYCFEEDISSYHDQLNTLVSSLWV